MAFFAIELAFALCALLVAAALAVLALVVGLITHPLRTLVLVLNRISALVGGLAFLLALVLWFGTDHDAHDFISSLGGCIGVVVVCVVLAALTQWFVDRPTRAELREMERQLLEQELAYEQRVQERLAWEREQRRGLDASQFIDASPSYVHDERDA